MQTQNNYTKLVFNGDVGTVVSVDAASQIVTVQFVDQTARYEIDDLDEIELAYAMTVHKSQGSEYPAVIIIMHPSHYVMLQRNLLYTALTRAQKLAVIVGNNRAIWRAGGTTTAPSSVSPALNGASTARTEAFRSCFHPPRH